MPIIGMVKVCTVRIKLPKTAFTVLSIIAWAGEFHDYCICKTAYNFRTHDIFTSNKDYLTPCSQTIHLIPSLTNLVDQQMR